MFYVVGLTAADVRSGMLMGVIRIFHDAFVESAQSVETWVQSGLQVVEDQMLIYTNDMTGERSFKDELRYDLGNYFALLFLNETAKTTADSLQAPFNYLGTLTDSDVPSDSSILICLAKFRPSSLS